MTSDGRVAQSVTPFSRSADGNIHFERPQFTSGRPTSMFQPIVQKCKQPGG